MKTIDAVVKVPALVKKRFQKKVPEYQKIVNYAQRRDANEADTVTIIVDMLEDIFGFSKYSEITREFVVRNTFCDLAIKTGNKIDYLIEVKAVGIELDEKHIRQAVDYAANGGVKWVVVTNGRNWQVYRVTLLERVQAEKIIEFNFLKLSNKSEKDFEKLFFFAKKELIRI